MSEDTYLRDISLRDYLAGGVMQALATTELYFGTIGKPESPWGWVAKEAYKAADAMLAERIEEADRRFGQPHHGHEGE